MSNFGKVDLTDCDREQIHIPGSIQSHGLLLCKDPATGIVEVVSGNTQDYFGCAPETVIGQPLSDLLRDTSYVEANRVWGNPDMVGLHNTNLELQEAGKPAYEGLLHHSSGYDILELEPYEHVAKDYFHNFYHRHRTDLYDLQNFNTRQELITKSCELVKQVTGYERVWFYRFDQEWNGQIVGEQKDEHLKSYLGLHYPASDIPEQARRLYTINRLRIIVDVDAPTVPLVPSLSPRGDKPIDLSLSSLRAISPLHIEYLQNMGVTATMTISLVRAGELIGLISCHDHRGAKFVPYEIRRSCEFLGFLLSQQLSELNEKTKNRASNRVFHFTKQIDKKLKDEESITDVLTKGSPNLLDLVEADGAAIVRGENIETVGNTPEHKDIIEILSHIQQSDIEECFCTHKLSELFPGAESYTDNAAGILAFTLSREAGDWVVWFRGERVREISWGGDPNKSIEKNPETGRIHPRKSFEKWQEVVKGCSENWPEHDVEALRPFSVSLMRFLRMLDAKKQYQIQEQLHQSQKMESIGKLAGGIAHDFNNILASIIGFTELSFEQAEKDPLLKDNLSEIYTAGNRAKELVKKILVFAQKSQESRKLFSAGKIIKEATNLLRPAVPANIEFRTEIDSELKINGSEVELQQVFLNLATNALHAMREKGDLLEVRLSDISVRENHPHAKLVEEPGTFVELVIRDNGSGIDQENLSTVFEPYWTTKGVGEGTGMGLALVQGIVESYGGVIQVESEVNKSTTFTVLLPASAVEGGEETVEDEGILPGVGRILFVDDEPAITKMATKIIERLGYSVTSMTNSMGALEFFRDNPNNFDLLITDMTMPSMTGDMLAMEIKKIRPDIPVILATGYSDVMSNKKAMLLGIEAFIYKPFEKAELAKTIKGVLDNC